jgi:hypothetical protein
MRTIWNRLALCSFFALPVGPATAADLDFASHPVAERYAGPNTAPILKSQQDRAFRTKLREAAKQTPNFAGHYIVTTFGCGSSCVMGAVIDARSGLVTWLPFTVCCWEDAQAEPVEYHLDSALMIVRGMRNEQERGTFYYLLQKGRLRPIATRPE